MVRTGFRHNPLRRLLAGGDRRSIAGADRVLSIVRAYPALWACRANGSRAVRFTDYFVPSLILFLVGVALALAALMVFRRHHLARANSGPPSFSPTLDLPVRRL
jgi:hypothetical protein